MEKIYANHTFDVIRTWIQNMESPLKTHQEDEPYRKWAKKIGKTVHRRRYTDGKQQMKIRCTSLIIRKM